MKEIISIHIGQCGVQIGNPCWEIYCNEHGIEPDGNIPYNRALYDHDDNFHSFFSETQAGKYVPRALFVDLDPSSINEIRICKYNKIYNSDFFINGNGNALNNYACGRYSLGTTIIDKTLDGIKLSNQCKDLEGFLIFHSLGGGTGSGFTSLLSERLNNEFPRKKFFEFTIFPSSKFSTSTTEPYNSVLSTHSTIDYFDCSFSFDNKSLYKVCSKELDVHQPNFFTMNQVVSHVASSISSLFRFKSEPDNSKLPINDMFLYHRAHYAICSYSPLYPRSQSCCQFSTDEITDVCFNPESVLIDCNPLYGQYLYSLFIYRGDNTVKDIKATIEKTMSNKRMQYTNWKVLLNYRYNEIVYKGDVGLYIRSLCLVSNNTAISDTFSRINNEFDLLYEKRSFIHSYINEGMEELEFKEARDDLADLESDYKDLSAWYEEDNDADNIDD